MSKKGGLGRGLGALIPPAPAYPSPTAEEVAPSSGPRLREIPLSEITPNPRQPRQVFDEDALAELAASIQQVGLLQPVVVRPTGPNRFELVMGERRWRAAQRAGLDRIPALVRETADDALLRDALLENIQREQLNPLEEAAAYAQLLDDFGATHEELARRLGRSRSHVSNTLRLLQLPPAVQRRVAAGVLSAGHARAVLSLPDPETQERLAARIVAEGMSVRQAEEAVALGEDIPRVRQRAARRGGDDDGPFAALAARLGDLLDTRVTVHAGRKRGRLTVEFASAEDLERILAVLSSGAWSLPEVEAGQVGAPGAW